MGKTALTVVLMPLLPAGSMTARPPPSLPPLNCATTALLSRLSLATETTAFLVILCKLALLPLLPLHLQPHPPTLLPPTLQSPNPPSPSPPSPPSPSPFSPTEVSSSSAVVPTLL